MPASVGQRQPLLSRYPFPTSLTVTQDHACEATEQHRAEHLGDQTLKSDTPALNKVPPVISAEALSVLSPYHRPSDRMGFSRNAPNFLAPREDVIHRPACYSIGVVIVVVAVLATIVVICTVFLKHYEVLDKK